MAHIFESLVKESSTTTGTGTYALAGAVTGHRAFSAVCANNDTAFYCARAVDASGNPTGDWEVGLGTWTTGNNLARTTILRSSNSNAAVNWAAGTKHIYLTLPAEKSAGLFNNDALRLPDVASPGVPPSGKLDIFSQVVAGRRMLAQVGPSGLDTALQPFVARNKIAWSQSNGNSTTVSTMGFAASNSGTATARNVATTNLFRSMRRVGFVSAATAGSSAGTRNAALQFWRGNASQLGGFLFIARFGVSDAATVSDSRLAAGMFNTVSAISNVNPSTLTHCVYCGCDNGATNLSIGVNDGTGTATTTSLGSNFPSQSLSTDMYEVAFFCPPNGSDIGYRVERLNTGDVAEGTLTTDLPGSSTLLSPQIWRNNGATASAIGIDVASIYVETDY